MKKSQPRDFVSWVVEHVRPSVEFDNTQAENDAYWKDHGGMPSPFDIGAAGKWADYVKANATFWIKFRFAF